MPDLSRALEVAVAAARAAGDLLRADFHRPGGPRGHGDKAEADVEAERVIRERLLAAFPGWGYLGEETGAVAGRPGAPVWLVDPNDGTRDFLMGRRGSSVSIGLVQEGRPLLGVVHPFAYPDDDGDLFAWADGLGPPRRGDVALSPRLPTALSPRDVVLVSSGGDRSPEANLRCAAPARYRAVPSIAHRLALVAAGEASATVSVFAPGAWDYAAGHALLRGAGGALLDETGSEVGYAADGGSSTRYAFAGSREVAAELAARPWGDVLGAPCLDPGPVRLQRGCAIADSGLLARAQGCLLGQVAGDSLGGLVEFFGPAEIEADYPGGPRELLDGGTWGLLAGQPTDDSEMALALARSIVEREGFDTGAVQAAYQEWRDSRPFDMGVTTRAGLEGRPDRASQANGSLMRASPLAVLAHALPPDQAAALARRDSALTHPSAVCGDSVAAFVVAGAHAIREGDGPRAAHAAALAWTERVGAEPAVRERLLRAAHEAPSTAECTGPKQGWVLVALQVAFHALLHFEGPEGGVVWSVRLGGDTDTNAAITGALLGAVHGREAVPPQWRRMVLSCRALGSAAKRPRPPCYWPTDVLELAERLLLAGRVPAA
jgi:ADP-ribosylglycohydrolase/fructose-1,6-bisphosphatase/inositol monophosphatase family enzyme